MTGRIYLIRNMVNGKGYVGQTVRSVKERLREHWSDAKSARTEMALHKALTKYGIDNFSVIEIASAQEGPILNELERHFIENLGTLSPSGYNISRGGKGRASGFSVSEETRQKMSVARKGKPSSKKGIPVSEEQKRKQSIAMTGRKPTEEQRRKMSEKSKGRKYPGRILSDEHKAKVSLSLIGNKRSVGRIHSEETKAKMSLKRKGVPLPANSHPWSEARRAAHAAGQLKKFESEAIQ